MPVKKHFSRVKDRSLAAYKDWIKQIIIALTGEFKDDMTPAEWEAQWRDFWGKELKSPPKAARTKTKKETKKKPKPSGSVAGRGGAGRSRKASR